MIARLPPAVVTRPLAQAIPLADRLRATGREAIVFPLLEISPLPDLTLLRERMQNLGDYAMVAFVSPNAIDAAVPLAGEWPRAVAVAVLGAGSFNALARHGITSDDVRIFCPVDRHRTDSETLLETLDLEQLRGRRVLLIRGETGRELLADALRAAGIEVDTLPAYRRTAPQLDDASRLRLTQLLDAGCEWIVTSSEALRVLDEMSRQVGGDEAVAKMRQQRFIVPHARIAETARTLGCHHVLLTASGDEHLLAALQSRP